MVVITNECQLLHKSNRIVAERNKWTVLCEKSCVTVQRDGFIGTRPHKSRCKGILPLSLPLHSFCFCRNLGKASGAGERESLPPPSLEHSGGKMGGHFAKSRARRRRGDGGELPKASGVQGGTSLSAQGRTVPRAVRASVQPKTPFFWNGPMHVTTPSINGVTSKSHFCKP